jgi:uroporphyrinogen-III synthase
MTRVLVLRPEPAAGRTVERARSLGLEAIAVPLFEIEPVTWQVPEPASYDGVLLTSASALRCGGDELQQLRGLKAYAVGSATADAARGAGFDVAATGDAGVDRLLGSIDPDLRLLHLCGEDRRAPTGPRQRIDALPVYRARPLDTPDLGQTSDAVALIHSPRAGRRFRELVSDRGSVSIAAISSAAAEACGSGWRTVEIAEQPNDEALLALAARLCNNHGQR